MGVAEAWIQQPENDEHQGLSCQEAQSCKIVVNDRPKTSVSLGSKSSVSVESKNSEPDSMGGPESFAYLVALFAPAFAVSRPSG